MNPELLQSLVEDVLFHLGQLAHRLLALRLVAKLGKNAIQQRDRRIVAAEKEVVRMTVRVGVHENGAAGLSIASRAANLLVVAFQAAGKCSMNHGPDIGFIDAHAEGRGGYHDVQLARS